jgi:uncharacterized protein YndB with AHSA1/START domain
MTAMASTKPSAQREVTITPIFDATRSLVFKLWTEPEHMAQRWGPKGFTNPVCELDARPGGAIRIHMRAPDGTVHPMSGTFREVIEPERLVFSAVAEDLEGNPLLEALTTVTFAAKDAAGQVFHTYSSYARGGDLLLGAFNWLDLTPKGRNESGIMSWVRLHDEYDTNGADADACCHSGARAAPSLR